MVRPKSVNIVEIAKKAKTSTASVSRVLNNQSGVSENLRLKIRGILEKEGTFSNHVAQRGVKLAVVIEMVEPLISAYTSSILSGIAGYALKDGIDISTIFVASGMKKDFDLLSVLRERSCDGVLLLFSNTVSKDILKKLIKARMAVFMLASQCELEEIGFIDTDPAEGTVTALQHLWDLGHRNIGFLSGLCENIYDNQTRADTFTAFMKDKGVKDCSPYLIKHQPTTYAQEAGYLQTRQALEDNPELTAIVANNDEMAYGAILACHEKQLKVPEDVSIVGFDDYYGSRFCTPPLTTVRQHLGVIGYDAAKGMDEYICGKIKGLPRKVLSPELILRQSTSAVRSRL
ncbi:MAG: LacI family DNA-binding transcriptional regulator [Planctomycetes bacterium]|nr:LacI family DNA-binding transcriptional regulator [Planctomycetota bacterium]